MRSLSELFDTVRNAIGLGRPPLQRAIRRAYRMMQRMSSDGIVVPEDIVLGIMAASDAERAGALTAEIETAFYAVNGKLIRLRRGQSHGDDDTKEPFTDALDDSDLLLKFAAETGHDVPRETVNPLLVARSAAAAGTVTQEIQANFYEAYGRLSKQFGDVSADTIRACRSEQTRRTLRFNRNAAICLTVAVATCSVGMFVADNISANIQANITAANQSAARLRATISQADISHATTLNGENIDPCKMIATLPSDGGRDRMAATEIEPLQNFAANVRDIRGQAIKLNWFIGQLECDTFASCGSARSEMCGTSCYPDPPVETSGLTRTTAAGDGVVPIRDRFELRPAIRNYTAEVLCKIEPYQEVRSFASNVLSNYKAGVGALLSHVFPIVYALLGAYAFRLRLFVDTIRNRTYHPSFADSARMITAVIAGAIAGLFNPATGAALSPLATAFLVGYGVELFFRLLDTLLNAFGSSSATPPRPSRAPG